MLLPKPLASGSPMMCVGQSLLWAQHEERRTDEEKQKIYEDCRVNADEYYTIYVSAGWQIVHTGGIRDNVSTQIDAFRSGQIFLQHRKNRDRFIRPERIVTPPLYMIHIEDSVGLGAKMAIKPDASNDVLILFPRDGRLCERAEGHRSGVAPRRQQAASQIQF